MTGTILFFLLFWLVLALSIPFLLVFWLLRLTGLKKAEKKFVYLTTSNWAKFVLFTAGIRLRISGKENIPPDLRRVVLVSNHQGNFDIPVYIACLPFSAGFIAKKELMSVPFISSWMRALDCLPIDRTNPRKSREMLVSRIGQDKLNPVFLFPEGTRSRGPQMGAFRTGTLKMICHNGAEILPVTIDGSYRCYEERNNIRGGKVNVIFHPVMEAKEGEGSGFDCFNRELQAVIASPLLKN